MSQSGMGFIPVYNLNQNLSTQGRERTIKKFETMGATSQTLSQDKEAVEMKRGRGGDHDADSEDKAVQL